MMRHALQSFLALAVVALCATACGQSAQASATPTLSPTETPTEAPTPTPIPQLTAAPAGTNRHGLAAAVPLPDHLAFAKKGVYVTFDLKPTNSFGLTEYKYDAPEIWIWTVAAPYSFTQVEDFYQQTLPQHGWSSINMVPNTGEPTSDVLAACAGNQVLVMGFGDSIPVTDANENVIGSVAAPNGGAVFVINLEPRDFSLGFGASQGQIFCS